MAFAHLLIINHFGKVLLLFIVIATSESRGFFFHFFSPFNYGFGFETNRLK